MKKFAAIVLALIMMMTIAVPAFAAEGDPVITAENAEGEAYTNGAVVMPGDAININCTYITTDTNDAGCTVTFYISGSMTPATTVYPEDETNWGYSMGDDETGYDHKVYYTRSDGVTPGTEMDVTLETYVDEDAMPGDSITIWAKVTDGSTDHDAIVEEGVTEFTFTVGSNSTPLTGQMGWECVIEEEDHECTFDETTGDMLCEGAIKTGLTHSVIDAGDGLQLDTDYVIDVIGKLDADNDGIPDDEETDPEPIPETPTIAVDIYWTDMVFNYQQQWNDTTLAYDWNWQNGEDYIKVDNRSSVGVNAGITFTGDTTNGYGDEAVEFEFMEDSAVAATWENNVLTLGYGNKATEEQLAEDATTVVTPSGTLNVNVAATTTMDTDTTDETAGSKTVTLGQITVNISAIIPPQTVTLGTVTAGTEHGINGGSFEARLYDTCKVVIDGLPSNDYNWVAAVEFACSFSDYFQPEWSFEKDDAGNWVLTFVLTPSYDGIDGTLVAGDTVEVYMPYIECADVEDNYTCLFTVTIVE